MKAVGISGTGAAAVFRGPTRESEGTQLPGSNGGVLYGCGERTDELECWECGILVCWDCARFRNIDGYEVVYCPVCAPLANEVNE